ncbi:unnamed protein product, partial [Porites evermanni]
PKPLKTLLLSLAVSDLGVGLVVHPLYIVCLVMNMEQNTNNKIYIMVSKAYFISGYLLCAASFFGIIALTVDRFLAIHLHLRYQELVTHGQNVLAIINATIGAVCLTTTGLIYCKIYLIVRHHTNQIHALQLQLVGQNQNGELANAARLKKTALATFYVYVVFVVCFLPFICVNAAYQIYGESELLLHLLYYSQTLTYLNSSLNPLVYCWKMRNIRQAVISVLRNIFQGYQQNEKTCISHYSQMFMLMTSHSKTDDSSKAMKFLCITSKTLLLSLADLVVGVLVEPLYVAIIAMNIEENSNNTAYYSVYKAYLIQKKVLVLTSHLGVFALTFEFNCVFTIHCKPAAGGNMRWLVPSESRHSAHQKYLLMTSANKRLLYTVYSLFGYLLGVASLLGITALTVDRFLAIHLHLRYQELVTHKRVVAVVISVWVWCSCISLFALNRVLQNVLYIINATIGAVCLTTTGLIYCKIYSIVRHHTNQIQALQLQPVGQNQNKELANAARLKKTALATFYVYVVLVVCFLPFICVKATYLIYGESELLLHLFYYSMTLVYLNSSLNPLIYCWKIRHIRQTVMDILRNVIAIGPH